MQMTTIANSGGNRALICCSTDNYADRETARKVFEDAVAGVLQEQTFERFSGAVYDCENDLSSVVLRRGDWERKLNVGYWAGQNKQVGVFFFNQPAPEPVVETQEDPAELDDETPEEPGEPIVDEPEPAPSVPQLVCDALQTAFADAICCASAFVVESGASEFELEVK